MREEIENIVEQLSNEAFIYHGKPDKESFVNSILSALKAKLIESAPKERFLFAGNVEANKGYNLYRKEWLEAIRDGQ